MKKILRMKREDGNIAMVRVTKKVKHHIKNRCNGGTFQPENLLLIEETKEKLIHKIFGNRDFYDIIIFILRISRAKHFERINPKIKELYKYI